MLKELVIKNRSYRGYDPKVRLTREELLELVDLTRYTASSVNEQPLRYYIAWERDEVEKILPLTMWAKALKDMQLQLGQMKSSNQVDPSFQEEYQKLKIVVDQQKLQLQSDVHFLLEKDTPFVEQCIDIVCVLFSSHPGVGDDAAFRCAHALSLCERASQVFAGPVGALRGGKRGLGD